MAFDKWVEGEPLSASKLNQPIDAIQRLLPIGDGTILTSQLPCGTGFTIPANKTWPDAFWATIKAKGPNDEDDYTDERYWILESYMYGGDVTDQIAVVENESNQRYTTAI